MPRDHDPITPQEGLDIVEFDIPVRDATPITLRTYRRIANRDEALPLLVYMHGGGYVFGGLETDDSTCRAIALELGIVVVNVKYRLAPEHKFPVGFEDSFDVVRWVSHVPITTSPLTFPSRLHRQKARASSTPISPRASSWAALQPAPTLPPVSRT